MSLNGLRILLAEDNPTNQLVATQMLETLGATVTLAVDGAEALEVITRETFDIALIDIEMPRLSGIQLIERVRAMEPPLSRMPLVALTAYVMREHRAAIDRAGADGIIAKPILSIEEFGEEIMSHVRPANDTGPAPGALPVEIPQTPGGVDDATFSALRSSFDDVLFEELLDKLAADVGSAADRVSAGLETEDLEELRAASHILISVAGAVGAFRLQELSQCLNSAGHAADSHEIELVGPELLEEAEDVLAFVRGIKGE